MRAASADNDAFDGSLAGAAGLAGAGVDVVVELEEACDAIGVHVVGDRGAAELDRLFQHFLQRRSQSR